MCHTCHAQQLNLYDNQIGDAGVTALANACATGAMALTVLHLGGNNITDDGLATLMPLMQKDGKLSNLTAFSIGSGITDKGMKEFSDLLAMGAMAQLQASSLLTALSPSPEAWCAHYPNPDLSFGVIYTEALPPGEQDWRRRHDQVLGGVRRWGHGEPHCAPPVW